MIRLFLRSINQKTSCIGRKKAAFKSGDLKAAYHEIRPGYFRRIENSPFTEMDLMSQGFCFEL
jgi:hypothetical protein